MSDIALLRIGILVAGVLLLAAIFCFGRPRKPRQGRRVAADTRPETGAAAEPSLGGMPVLDDGPSQGKLQPAVRQPEPGLGAPAEETALGKRPDQDFDKIVSLYVAARAGHLLRGEDIVVAAEKTGLVFGHLNVFHRLVDGHPERGPVFSMANILQPGSFDMGHIRDVETPAIAFFLTLPAPMSALDAWEKMLPTVQRIGELLDGVVLDDGRNALGRQRIANIRDELRSYDRQHEAPPLGKPLRW